jgi:hypothetical protein
MFPALIAMGAFALALAAPSRAAEQTRPASPAVRAADTCATAPARPPAARPRPASGDPFLAAMLGAFPLTSGFYVSEAPIKGVAFSLADVMLIGAIIQIRSDANRPPKDAAAYYWLLAGVNLADAVLSALQVQSDAAKRLSVNINPSDRPGFLLGWRF